MSLSFDNPMNDATSEMISKFFGPDVAASDRKNVLVNDMQKINGAFMKEIANSASQPVTVTANEVGEIKKMSDGTKYEVTSSGWKKV